MLTQSLSLALLLLSQTQLISSFKPLSWSSHSKRHNQIKLQANEGATAFEGPESTPLLDSVNYPHDLKRFDIKQLKQLSHELRWETINAVSKTGGHLSSSLGM